MGSEMCIRDSVYTSFGFEGINSAVDRDTVMSRILNWLDPTILEIDKEASISPDKLSITTYPNPFNSSCVITANVGGACMCPAKIEIYDLRGNVVKVLRAKPLPQQDATHTFIWTPDENISSEVYLIKATTKDGLTTTKRIIYLK